MLISPIVLALVRFEGLDTARFLVQLGAVLLLDLVLAGVLTGRGRRGSVAFALVVLPLVFTPLWFFGVQVGVSPGGFWDYGAFETAGKSALLVTAAAVTAMIYRALGRGATIRKYGYVYLVLFVGIWFAQLGPRFLAPTYTIVDACYRLGP